MTICPKCGDELQSGEMPLKVSVSGSTLYKAVVTYLKNDETLQNAIKEKVDIALDSEAMKKAIEKRLERALVSWSIKDDLVKAVQELATKQVKNFLTDDKVAEIVKKVFSKMIVK
jgi:hypothetical protein